MREVVARRLAELRSRVARVRELLPDDAETFRAQRTESEALTLNLYLAVQCTIDLAMHLVAERALGVPGGPREALELLERSGLLDRELAVRLNGAVGLRNRIAHQYGTLDLERVYLVARDDLGDLEWFARSVASMSD